MPAEWLTLADAAIEADCSPVVLVDAMLAGELPLPADDWGRRSPSADGGAPQCPGTTTPMRDPEREGALARWQTAVAAYQARAGSVAIDDHPFIADELEALDWEQHRTLEAYLALLRDTPPRSRRSGRHRRH